MSPPRAAGVLLLAAIVAALAAGCRHEPARRDVEEALAFQHAIALPSVATERLAAPPRAVRVLVSPSALDVDAVELFASWPETRRARLLHEMPEEEASALPFVHRGLVRFAGGRIAMPDTPEPGQYEIRALADVLAYARALQRRYDELEDADDDADLASRPPPEVVVYTAAATPYAILVAVLFTIAQSEYQPTMVVRARVATWRCPSSCPEQEVGASTLASSGSPTASPLRSNRFSPRPAPLRIATRH